MRAPARAPEAPAAAARPSLLSRLFGWLSAPPPVAAEPSPAARNEQGTRHGMQRDHSRGRDRDRDRDQRSHGDPRRDRGERGERGGRGRNRGQRAHNDGAGQRPMREPGDGGNRQPQEGRREHGQQHPQRSGQGRPQGQGPSQGQGGEPRPEQPPQGQQAQGGGRGRRGRNRARPAMTDRVASNRASRVRKAMNGGQPPQGAHGDAQIGGHEPARAHDVHSGGHEPPRVQDAHNGGHEPPRVYDAPAERTHDSLPEARTGGHDANAAAAQTTDWQAHWIEPRGGAEPREARERPARAQLQPRAHRAGGVHARRFEPARAGGTER